MTQNQKIVRSTLIPLCAVLAASVCVACSDKKTVTTNVPAPAPASAPANTSSSSSARHPARAAEESLRRHEHRHGWWRGGTVASSGKTGYRH